MMHKDWILISAAALLLTTSCGKTPSSGQNSTEYSSEEFSSLFCDGCWYLDSVNGVYDWESAGKDIPSYCLKPKRDGTMIRYHGLPWAPEDGYDLSYSLSEWSYDEKTGALSFDAKDVIRIASVKSINQSVLKLIVIPQFRRLPKVFDVLSWKWSIFMPAGIRSAENQCFSSR